MKAPLTITSTKNPRIKELVELSKPRERRATGLFTVEGAREIGRAHHCAFDLKRLFFCNALLSEEARAVLFQLRRDAHGPVEFYEVSASVFERIAVRDGSDGLLAVYKIMQRRLQDLKLSKQALILAVEGIEKPGNLGALLRSADGAGCDAVIMLGKSVDPFGPNVVRSSLGTVFNVPVVACGDEEFAVYCKERGIKVVGAALDERSCLYTKADLRGATAVLVGTEALGISPGWISRCEQLIQIPMLGVADSLNVSAAGAVILYEAVRQRENARADRL